MNVRKKYLSKFGMNNDVFDNILNVQTDFKHNDYLQINL